MQKNKFDILDYANIIKEDKIKKQMIDPKRINEQIYMSVNLTKINKRTSEQPRIFVISNMGIYNIKKRDIKRTIDIHNIFAITISSKSQEFVIHGKGEYDIRYRSIHREVILSYLIFSFTQACNKQLRVFVTNKELLKDFCTQEDDFKSNISKIPQWEPYYVDSNQNLNLFFANVLLQMPQYQKVIFIKDPKLYQIWLSDFDTGLILGKGSFGDIYLVKHKQKDQMERYALKIIKQQDLGDQTPSEFEKVIAQNFNSKFTVPMTLAFRQNNDFYIMSEVMQGGDLFKQIYINQYIAEQSAKFYFVEILFGLDFFHSKGFVYKDLKPENILIDSKGHVHLSNNGFVFCKNTSNDQIHATIDYTAPEVLNGSKYTKQSDYWSLGILLYELVIGVPPFYHENEDLVIHLIRENKITFPTQNQQEISPQCQNLILGLLNTDPKKRLNFNQVKNHEWLKTIDWEDFQFQNVSPPFVPKLRPESYIVGKYFDYKVIDRQDII